MGRVEIPNKEKEQPDPPQADRRDEKKTVGFVSYPLEVSYSAVSR